MRSTYLIVVFLGCSLPCQAQEKITVPLSLADQAKLIPVLCDRALFGYRAELQQPCEQIKAALAQAVANEEKKKTEESKPETEPSK